MTEEQGVPVAVPTVWPNQGPSSLVKGGSVRSRATTVNAERPSARLTGRRGLLLVQASLSDRDWDVLRLVARHRFLTTRQIEDFCFFDHATPMTCARVCRRTLRRLADVRVLDHLERRIGGVRAGSASFVWQVGPVGDRLLRSERHSARTRQHEPGSLFLQHCLDVADAHLALTRIHRAGQLELVSVQTEPDCWRSYTGLGGARLTLEPDLYVETGDPADAAFVNCWFVEVDRGTENPARLLAKCERYESYRRTGREQAEAGGFPLVVWVMRDPQHAERLVTAIQGDSRLDDQLYRVTTAEQLTSAVRGSMA
jgi:Replication-relaxation